jgi:hypothetical protein
MPHPRRMAIAVKVGTAIAMSPPVRGGLVWRYEAGSAALVLIVPLTPPGKNPPDRTAPGLR